jgi:glucose/arabinose dehydrogenase
LIRVQQPFGNHNGGQLGFNPVADTGDPDFGMLYVGVADGGSGGDPMNLSQNPGSAFGKILRIDPLGENSANGAYGVPADNPFAGDGDPDTLGEIFALGVRNPQRFAWDPETGAMFVADIGQNTVEELSPVTPGANLGWNVWEGSFRYVGRDGVDVSDPRSDPAMTYPIAEYDHRDGLMIGGTRAAVTGVHVYRAEAIPQLADLILFGDNPSGEVFFVSADDLPEGGASGIGRILLNDGGEAKTLLQIVQEKNAEQGREPAGRVDLRFGSGPDGQVFLLNKQDGVIRLLVAPE